MSEFLLGTDFFAKAIADKSGMHYAQIEQRTFPDSEVCPRIGLNIKNGDECILCTRLYTPINVNSYLMEILLLLGVLEQGKITCRTLLMPYLVYARQDRAFREGEPVSFETVMKMLHDHGIEKIITVTSHTQREKAKFFCGSVEIININGFLVLQDYLKNFPAPVLVAPDKGSEKWVAALASALGGDCVVVDKERDKSTGAIASTLGDKEKQKIAGKNVMIVDDIISSGLTMLRALELCKGARKVGCAAVHGLFTAGSEKLRGACKNIVTTDTVHSEYANITVTGMIAEEIMKMSK